MKKQIGIVWIVLIVCSIVLTSCTSKKSYTITFNSNGGIGEMIDFFVETGQMGDLPNCEFTKEGFECLSWSTDNSGESLYGDIQKLSNSSSVVTESTIELFAVWTTPGFSFGITGIGFLLDGVITRYNGTAKDVVVPAYLNDFMLGHGFVKKISSNVFSGHSEIERVKNLPTTYISEQLFFGCTSLQTIETRNEIISIYKQAFYNCIELTSFDLGGRCKTIGEEAFYNCTSIKKIIIPASITEIETRAFAEWDESQTIEFIGHQENVFGNDWLVDCKANIIWAK